MPPTIVLVHGAFAESASWDRVIRHLEDAADVPTGEAARMAVPTASHAVAVSHPEATARLVLRAVSRVPVAA